MTLVGNGGPLSYASFVTGIFDLYGKSHGKALVGNKTPDAVRKLDTLHAIWPQARFVHVIRDGRDVALSMFNWSSVQQKKPGPSPRGRTTLRQPRLSGGSSTCDGPELGHRSDRALP